MIADGGWGTMRMIDSREGKIREGNWNLARIVP